MTYLWTELAVVEIYLEYNARFEMYLSISVFCHSLVQPTTENLWIIRSATKKKLEPQNIHEKKICTQEIPTRKTFGATKYPQEKISDPGRHNGTMAHDRLNLTHSVIPDLVCVVSPENGKSNKLSLRFWIIIDHLVI